MKILLGTQRHQTATCFAAAGGARRESGGFPLLHQQDMP